MAATQVFTAPELLEMVLQDVPFNQLVILQQVNRTWKGTITRSPKLQRKLFNQPAKGLLPICRHDEYKETQLLARWENNVPMRKRKLEPYNWMHNHFVKHGEGILSPLSTTPYVTLHPLLNNLWAFFVAFDTYPIDGRMAILPRMELDVDFKFFDESCRPSWYDMLLTQPPCKTARVKVFFDFVDNEDEGLRWFHPEFVEFTAREKEGLRFRDIWEEALPMARRLGGPDRVNLLKCSMRLSGFLN